MVPVQSPESAHSGFGEGVPHSGLIGTHSSPRKAPIQDSRVVYSGPRGTHSSPRDAHSNPKGAYSSPGDAHSGLRGCPLKPRGAHSGWTSREGYLHSSALGNSRSSEGAAGWPAPPKYGLYWLTLKTLSWAQSANQKQPRSKCLG